MLCIKENLTDQQVIISVEGKIDRDSLPTLKEVCSRHLESKKALAVVIQFHDMQGISIDAVKYLKHLKKKVSFLDLPDYLEMELFS